MIARATTSSRAAASTHPNPTGVASPALKSGEVSTSRATRHTGRPLTIFADSLTCAVFASSSRSSAKRLSTSWADLRNSPWSGAPVLAETVRAQTMSSTPGASVRAEICSMASAAGVPHETSNDARANSRLSGPVPIDPT